MRTSTVKRIETPAQVVELAICLPHPVASAGRHVALWDTHTKRTGGWFHSSHQLIWFGVLAGIPRSPAERVMRVARAAPLGREPGVTTTAW